METGNGHNKDKIENYPQEDCHFAPGTPVPESGLYEICHADEGRATVVFMRDETFPQCRQCGENVRYKLLRSAPHISEDPDFSDQPAPEDNPVKSETAPIKKSPRQLGADYGYRYWQQPL